MDEDVLADGDGKGSTDRSGEGRDRHYRALSVEAGSKKEKRRVGV